MTLSTMQIMERNLGLAEQHLSSVLENPQLFEGIPQDAHVIFLPAADPELLEANLEIASELARSMGDNGSRKPIVLMLLPVQNPDITHRSLPYDLDVEPTYVRLHEDDQDTPAS